MRVMATGIVPQELGQLGPGTDSPIATELQVNLKRHRRPSVRLGEIGDEPMPLVLKKLLKRRKPRLTSQNATPAYAPKFVDGVGNRADPMDWRKPKRIRPLKQAARASTNGDEMHYANNDEILAEGFLEEVEVEDDDADAYLQPLRRAHVGLKKRTKRGKHGRRKRVLADRSTVSSAKIAKILEENSKDIANLSVVGGASNAIGCNPLVGSNAETLEIHPKGFDCSQFQQKVTHDIDSCKEREKAHDMIEGKGDEKLSMKEGDDFRHKEVNESKHESIFQEEAMNEVPNLEMVKDPEVSCNPHLNGVAVAQTYFMAKPNEGITHLVDSEGPALNCEVARWLEALNLGKYAYLFQQHEVDKDVLPHLTIDDLREMGIVAVGARRKLFTAIQALSHKE